MLREIMTAEELGHRLRRNGFVVVLFTAEWNNQTEEVKQLLEEMAVRYKDVLFVEVDVDRGEVIANELSVEAVPTVVVFKNGRRIEFIEAPSTGRLQLMREDHFFHLS